MAIAVIATNDEDAALLVDALSRTTDDVEFAPDGDPCIFVAAGPEDEAPPAALRVERDALLDEPATQLRRICEFAGLTYDQALLTPIEALRRAGAAGTESLASVSTTSFAQLLTAAGSSLLVSTYQTNKLVCARVPADGSGLNTHFRDIDKPMGLAVAPGRVALGTRTEVWDLRDMPAAAAKIEPAGSHDACFLPRNRHVTGDIAVHELAFAGGELWVVATAFSCLATLDAEHSFVPRWAPPFISTLTNEEEVRPITIQELRIGFTTLRELPAFLIEGNDHRQTDSDGLLPLQLFDRVTFDGPRRAITIEP